VSQDLPPIVLLRAFDAAGRHLSFARAAQALGVTPSTISHQIADLEAWMGAALFVRARGGLALTAEGSALLADVAAAFERLRAASARLRQRGAPTQFRLSANPFFATEVVIPLLPAFDRAFPGRVLHVHSTESLEDPRDRGVDFCVRVGASDEAGLERHPIYPIEIAPVVAAALDATQGLPRIDFPFRGSSAWREWSTRAGHAQDATPARQFSTFHAALRATQQGLGIGLAMLPTCAPLLHEDRLQRVARLPAVPLGRLDLVCRPFTSSERIPAAVRDWLIEAFRRSAGWTSRSA
jgi:LysR family glycine cleavage system transcriptional activator